MSRRYILVLLPALAVLPSGAAAAKTPETVAVFDFSLIDTGLQAELAGLDPADLERLAKITAYVREEVGGADAYDAIDPGPTKRDAYACNGCELAAAKAHGADLALVGWVQKVSNLILNLNVELRDVASGRTITGGSVDLRGNTDDSWYRGARAALRNTGLVADAKIVR